MLYSLIICIDATRSARSLRVGVLSIASAFIQLTGYGCGFLSAWWRQCVRGKSEFEAFKGNFYK